MITIICRLLHSDLTGQYRYTIHQEFTSQRLQLNRDTPLFPTMPLWGTLLDLFFVGTIVYENDSEDQRVPGHAIRKYHVRVPQITLLTSCSSHCLFLSFSALHFASMRFPLPSKTITLLTNNWLGII